MKTGFALASVLLVTALAGCRRVGSIGPYPDASIVLVSIDTLRADRLPAYGYAVGATPHLDALARDGILFEDVYSHCPLTLPSHASLLTGLLPPRHGLRDNAGFTLDAGHRTLASRFGAAGYRTGAAVSAYVLRAETGVAQGFDVYEDAIEPAVSEDPLTAQRDGAVAVDALLRWIEAQRGARFFVLLHLYEPHAPYAPPERYRRVGQPYDGDVAYADELVGRFLARLEATGLASRLLVAVTSDHGEGLMDHGEQEHGIFLYRESLRVPLILRLPDRAQRGARLAGPVGLVDVAATLLDLAGLPADGLDGASLRSTLSGHPVASQPIYSETLFPRYHFGWSELFAVTEARYHFIRAPQPELYDVVADPGERRNLMTDQPRVVAAMDEWLTRTLAGGAVPLPAEVAPETRERLEALGYIGVGAARGSRVARGLAAAPAGSLPDPKEKIGIYQALKDALELRRQGRLEEAATSFRRLAEAHPQMPDAPEQLGLTLLRMGRNREAVASLERARAHDPKRSSIDVALVKAHTLLGLAAQQGGRCREALASFERAERVAARAGHPIPRGLRVGRGDCLALLGRHAEAERDFRAEIEAAPDSLEARVGLAMLLRAHGRDAAARDVLGGLLSALPSPTADDYGSVIQAFSELGDAAAARQWRDRARALFQDDPRFR